VDSLLITTTNRTPPPAAAPAKSNGIRMPGDHALTYTPLSE
jgi:hypothetical protein